VRVDRLIDSGTWWFPNFYKIDKCVAMHHSKKFFIAVQELFAAMQQKGLKPHLLIKKVRFCRLSWRQTIAIRV
jgi:hypothetical protein